MRYGECGCPLKSSVPSCFFLFLAEQSAFKSWKQLTFFFFRKSTFDIDWGFYQTTNHDKEKKDRGWQVPKTERKDGEKLWRTSTCWNIRTNTAYPGDSYVSLHWTKRGVLQLTSNTLINKNSNILLQSKILTQKFNTPMVCKLVHT